MIKKIGMTVLFLCGALLFAGCNSASARTETAETQEYAQTVGGCIYTIVRPELSSEDEKEAAIRLRKELEELCGAEIAIVTDWYNEHDKNSVERYEYEIVIGRSERRASQDMIAELHEGTQEALDYIIRGTDRDYVICTSEGSAEAAVDAFLSIVKTDPSILGKEPDAALDQRKKHEFPCADYSLFGKPISEYTAIVYPAAYRKSLDVQQLKQLTELQEDIYRLSGVKLPLLKDSEYESGSVIRFGSHDDELLGDYGYSVSSSDEGVRVTGVDYYTDLAALDVLLSDIATAENGQSTGYTEELRKTWEVTEDTVHRAAWVIGSANMTAREQFEEIAECGFDLIITAKPVDESVLDNYCKWMAECGLRALWWDGSIAEGVENPDYQPYVFSPVTWGNMMRDEPSLSSFEALAARDNDYSENVPGKFPFVNLFPSYASAEQLGCDSYSEYVEKYIEIVDPSYLSVDIYPLYTGGIVYSSYLDNLDMFCTPCREAGISYGLYIQSVIFAPTKRAPEEHEMRWQSYIGLSFGVTNIEYFTYRTPDSETETFQDALIGRDNQKTEAWYGAQKVNLELAALGPVFAQYRNLGAFTVNAARDYMQFRNQYDFSDTVSVTADDNAPVLIGAFDQKNGSGKALTLVNLYDPAKKKAATVHLAFAENVPVTLYRAGIPETVLPDTNGSITVALEAGEGVFLTVG